MGSVELTGEQKQQLRHQFELLDVNGDGHVTTKEMAQVCQSMGLKIAPEALVDMIKEADANYNGLLQFDDFILIVQKYAPNDGSAWGTLLSATSSASKKKPNVLSDEQVKKLRKLFDEIDVTKNGHLTAPEIHLLFTKTLRVNISIEEVNEMIKIADTSGNGQVEFSEFLDLVTTLQASNAGLWGQLLRGIDPKKPLLAPEQLQELRSHFDQLDLDGNGHVTCSELSLMFKALKVPVSQVTLDNLIKEADTNQNGEIEFEEFVALCYNLKDKDESSWSQLLQATNPTQLAQLQRTVSDFFGIKSEANKKDIQVYRTTSAFQLKSQSAENGYWSQTLRKARGVLQVKQVAREVEMNKNDVLRDPKVRKQLIEQSQKVEYRPYFLLIMTLVQLGMMAAELIVNDGFADPIDNVLLGPSTYTLLSLGAKYAPCMRPNPEQLAETPYVPCGVYPESKGETINGTCYVPLYSYYSYFCGMGGFDVPNQWWRFFIPIFMHSGLIDLAVTVIFQVWKGFPIEKDIGPIRMFIIYLFAGVFGVAWSANMSPNLVGACGTGPVFALLGLLYLDLFQNWPLIQNPWTWFSILSVVWIILIGIGLLPFIDNFSHLGGFIMGILVGALIIPHISFGKWDGRRKLAVMILSVPLIFASFFAAFFTFYYQPDSNYCDWCSGFDCVPLNSGWCASSLSI